MLPTSIEYPLFHAAHDRFRELQPDPQDIAAVMNDAGLAVELSYDDFPLAFLIERYATMVRDRYLSLLSMFDDEELAAGVERFGAGTAPLSCRGSTPVRAECQFSTGK